MVFWSGSGSLPVPEASNRNNNNTSPVFDQAMASGSSPSTAIAKSTNSFAAPGSQKWSLSQSQSPHRFRKLSLADSPSSDRDAVVRAPVSAAEIGSSDRKGKMVRLCDRVEDRAQVGNAGEEVPVERKSTKIVLRLSVKSKAVCEVRGGEAAEPLAVAVNEEDQNLNQNQTAGVVTAAGPDGDSGSEEGALKTWNFRPRKPLVKKQPGAVVSLPKGGRGGPEVKKSQGQSQAKGNNGKKKKNEKEIAPKLSVSLSKQEIEEDIFVMTGSKPSRRPKKRAKHVQKQLDSIFPGLWLYSISADAYKVPDPPLKNYVYANLELAPC